MDRDERIIIGIILTPEISLFVFANAVRGNATIPATPPNKFAAFVIDSLRETSTLLILFELPSLENPCTDMHRAVDTNKRKMENIALIFLSLSYHPRRFCLGAH